MTPSPTPIRQRLERVPDRRLPIFYFVFGHLCLLAAFAAFTVVPHALAGFFYHPKMLAVVHLVTLGWITSSILGALYMILPMALHSSLPARRSDRWAFWCFVVGVLGMVSHFWIDESSGMVWSAAMVVGALVVVGWRVLWSLAAGRAPLEHRAPFYLAFGNIVLAGLLGMLIGLDQVAELLPGFVLDHVTAHAHLAALGWATFMVMGAGYRLLPMFLPAAVPRGGALLAEALLTEGGLLGLVVGLYLGAAWVAWPGLLYLIGVTLFLRRVYWMLRNRRPAPRDLVRPDLAFGHIGAAFCCLILAAAAGLWMATMPTTESMPRLVMLYGIFGLVGFLAQMVVGISVRLLPLYAWMRQFSTDDFAQLPPSPHALPARLIHWWVLALWGVGVPLLAVGLALDLFWAIRLAGVGLGLAVLLSLFHLRVLMRRHATTPVEIQESPQAPRRAPPGRVLLEPPSASNLPASDSRIGSDLSTDQEFEHAGLQSGARVAVIGGGPAGAFFASFVLDLASKLDLDVRMDIFEPKQFSMAAPYGCNMCGGIVSESLVQMLAAEGIDLPQAVVQRGIDSYVLHTNEETVRIETPLHEKRIGAVHRGAGPRDIKEFKWHSFDGHLLDKACQLGASVIAQRVSKVDRIDDRWEVTDQEGETRPYDLLAVATGVNAGALKLFKDLPIAYEPPQTTKTFIREYLLGEEVIDQYLGNAMHVFLMDLPGLQFAAIIPKGDYVTVCLLGEKLDNKLLDAFLHTEPVRSCFPPDWDPTTRSCQCAPKISVKAAAEPYADGLVFIGDSGATRLYKDGIGAAYKTAKAAAKTVIFEGISAGDFKRHYMPVCRKIERDNFLGKMAFWVAGLIQQRRFARRAVVQMTRAEQEGGARVRMSNVLWDLFTGSSPYREIFLEGVHPVFIGRILWHLTRALGWRPKGVQP